MGILDFDFYIPKASRKTAILDTNLLILHITGKVDPSLLYSFKRVKQFALQDIEILDWLLEQFAEIVTTAYVLTEASNLGNALNGEKHEKWFTQLASYATLAREAHVQTQLLGTLAETVQFGFADSALSYLGNQLVIITTEHRLSGYLISQEIEVLNFNHLRLLWMVK